MLAGTSSSASGMAVKVEEEVVAEVEEEDFTFEADVLTTLSYPIRFRESWTPGEPGVVVYWLKRKCDAGTERVTHYLLRVQILRVVDRPGKDDVYECLFANNNSVHLIPSCQLCELHVRSRHQVSLAKCDADAGTDEKWLRKSKWDTAAHPMERYRIADESMHKLAIGYPQKDGIGVHSKMTVSTEAASNPMRSKAKAGSKSLGWCAQTRFVQVHHFLWQNGLCRWRQKGEEYATNEWILGRIIDWRCASQPTGDAVDLQPTDCSVFVHFTDVHGELDPDSPHLFKFELFKDGQICYFLENYDFEVFYRDFELGCPLLYFYDRVGCGAMYSYTLADDPHFAEYTRSRPYCIPQKKDKTPMTGTNPRKRRRSKSPKKKADPKRYLPISAMVRDTTQNRRAFAHHLHKVREAPYLKHRRDIGDIYRELNCKKLESIASEKRRRALLDSGAPIATAEASTIRKRPLTAMKLTDSVEHFEDDLVSELGEDRSHDDVDDVKVADVKVVAPQSEERMEISLPTEVDMDVATKRRKVSDSSELLENSSSVVWSESDSEENDDDDDDGSDSNMGLELKKINGKKFDAVIVGGGMAGMSCAWGLLQSGVENVAVLEAQDYIGGRLKPYTLPRRVLDNGKVLSAVNVEMGAAFLSGRPEDNRLWHWLAKNGARIHDTSGGYNTAFLAHESWLDAVKQSELPKEDIELFERLMFKMGFEALTRGIGVLGVEKARGRAVIKDEAIESVMHKVRFGYQWIDAETGLCLDAVAKGGVHLKDALEAGNSLAFHCGLQRLSSAKRKQQELGRLQVLFDGVFKKFSVLSSAWTGAMGVLQELDTRPVGHMDISYLPWLFGDVFKVQKRFVSLFAQYVEREVNAIKEKARVHSLKKSPPPDLASMSEESSARRRLVSAEQMDDGSLIEGMEDSAMLGGSEADVEMADGRVADGSLEPTLAELMMGSTEENREEDSDAKTDGVCEEDYELYTGPKRTQAEMEKAARECHELERVSATGNTVYVGLQTIDDLAQISTSFFPGVIADEYVATEPLEASGSLAMTGGSRDEESSCVSAKRFGRKRAAFNRNELRSVKDVLKDIAEDSLFSIHLYLISQCEVPRGNEDLLAVKKYLTTTFDEDLKSFSKRVEAIRSFFNGTKAYSERYKFHLQKCEALWAKKEAKGSAKRKKRKFRKKFRRAAVSAPSAKVPDEAGSESEADDEHLDEVADDALDQSKWDANLRFAARDELRRDEFTNCHVGLDNGDGFVVDGYSRALEAVATSDVRKRVCLNAAVQCISQVKAHGKGTQKGVVEVHGIHSLTGKRFCIEAKRVCVTVSVGVLKLLSAEAWASKWAKKQLQRIKNRDKNVLNMGNSKRPNGITFVPELSASKRAAIAAMDMGLEGKCFLRFTEAFWRRPGGLQPRAGYFQDCSHPQFRFVDYTHPQFAAGEGVNVLCAMIPPKLTRCYQTDDAHWPLLELAVARHMCKVLGALFAMERLSDVLRLLVDYKVTDWHLNRYVRGSYSYLPPASLRRHCSILGKAEGLLHFAGEATSEDGFQCLDGAHETGFKAATQIIQALDPASKR